MKMTAAKAKIAALGATLTAIVVGLGPLQDALADGHIDAGEATGLISVAVTLVATVWAVWRTPNKPVVDGTADQDR